MATTVTKLAWRNVDGQFSFLFQNAFNKMIQDFAANKQNLESNSQPIIIRIAMGCVVSQKYKIQKNSMPKKYIVS